MILGIKEFKGWMVEEKIDGVVREKILELLDEGQEVTLRNVPEMGKEVKIKMISPVEVEVLSGVQAKAR